MPVNELLPAGGANFVASVQGADALSVDDVLQKFWDAFRLPDYFGWNWPALRDCLRDLGWLSSDHYLLVMSDVEKILPGDQESRRELFGVLVEAGKRWSCVRHPEGVETGKLRIVLVCGESDFEDLRSTFEHLLNS